MQPPIYIPHLTWKKKTWTHQLYWGGGLLCLIATYGRTVLAAISHQPSKGNRGRFPRQLTSHSATTKCSDSIWPRIESKKKKRQNSDQMEVNIPYMEQSWSIWDFSHSGRSTFRARLDKMSCTNLSYTSHILSNKICYTALYHNLNIP